MTKQEAIQILAHNKKRLNDFHVTSLSLFGSIVRDEVGPNSDIDILVEFNKNAHVGLFELFRLQTFLSDILGYKADLVTPDALHPMLKDDILREVVRAA